MRRKIPIYRAEVDAGLSQAIQAQDSSAVFAYCPILLNQDVARAVREETKVKNTKSFEQATALNEGQFDLHYIYTILSTTGWNRNDDVFDRQEMWAARNTAEDKPFNKSHDPNNIIGHITGNAVVNENYELVNDNSDIDSLPDKFHILTSAVVYKHVSSRDEKLTIATEQLLQEIAAGKWFVSMEALFSNFDYALTDADGTQTTVLRNEETAFLSKHLRSYGGDGGYDGTRVGRLMRNLTFSGKGLVENPGNPESIIFKKEDNEIFKGVARSNQNINLLVTSSSKGESSMSEHNEQVHTLEAQVSKLEARLRDMDEEKVRAQISTFEKACADKDAEISELTSKLAEVTQANEDSATHLQSLEETKANSEKQIAELTKKLDAIEAESIRTIRISSLVDKGVDKAQAESLVDIFTGISDEQFESLVETHEKLVEAAGYPFNKKKKDDDEDDEESDAGQMKKKYSEKAEEAEAEAEEVAEATDEAKDAEALEGAEAEDAASLAAGSENEGEAVVASLNEYFSEVLGGTNNKKES